MCFSFRSYLGIRLKDGGTTISTSQLRVFQYGERLVDRIDFEELALKGVDPSLGPSILHPSRLSQRTVDEKEGSDPSRLTVSSRILALALCVHSRVP